MFTPFDSPETTVLIGALVVVGYLLAVRGWTFLVAGYDDDSDISQDTVADRIGRFALVVGAATIGFGAVTTSSGYGPGWQGIVFGATVLLATVGLTYQLNTYEDSDTSIPAEPTADPVEPTAIERLDSRVSTEAQTTPAVEEPTGGAVDPLTTPVSQPARPPVETTPESGIEDPPQAEGQQPAEISN